MNSGSKDARRQMALFNQAPYAMKAADDEAKNEYVTKLATASQRIDLDVQALRQSVEGEPQSHIDMLRQNVNVRNLLILRRTQDLDRHRAAADSYFGSTPFGKSPVEYAIATYRLTVQMRMRRPALIQALKSAYHAAYSAQLDEAEIQILQAQIATLHQAIANAEAQALVQAQLEAEAAARAQAEAEAAARAQAEAEAAARAQAEAEAAARAQAEAEAAARAQAEAEAAARAQAEARAEAEAHVKAQEAAERALAEQAVRQANTYKALLSEVAAKPAIVMATAAAPVLEAGVALGTAIRSAVASLSVASIEAVAGPFLVGTFALLYAPKLGNGELPDNYVLTSPLTDLTVELNPASQAAALELGTVDLPVRMGDKREQVGSIELFAARTGGAVIPSTVPVLAAAYDAPSGQYTVTTGDIPSRTLTWTPAVEPQDSSTTLPATPPSGAALVGPTLEPLEGRLDIYPELPDFGFDDYVIIFPADSGLPPLYVMFKSSRNKPGVVSGNGVLHKGPLLVEDSENGAAIPTSIADQLRGKSFSSFDAFRRQLWKVIADSSYSDQFDEAALYMMRKGLAPLASASEQVGGRIKYEIHHKIKIVEGGAVYDVDNIVILSPKFHINIHRKG
ncbi:S-type pyocin domain-containing protein [Pseudomonas sp. NPDC089743]|uniref:S-type pyocin domain-containing protein n=1 Tax=Pseudomonas sp. NPDC089743 TaxID=3364471 RepID=UPI00382DFD5B